MSVMPLFVFYIIVVRYISVNISLEVTRLGVYSALLSGEHCVVVLAFNCVWANVAVYGANLSRESKIES